MPRAIGEVVKELASIVKSVGSLPADALMLQKNAKKRKLQNSSSLPPPKRRRLAPAAISQTVEMPEPKIRRSKDGMRVSHRELLYPSITGSNSFVLDEIQPINPGLSAAFPWLYSISQNWEQYRVHSLVYEYVPIASTATQGDVFMAPLYDVTEAAPGTEQQFMNLAGAKSCSVWDGMQMAFKPAAMMGLGPRKYVRTCNVAGDQKTYDVGTILIATNNETGNTAIGKVFVSYDIEFYEPSINGILDSVSQQTSFGTNVAIASIVSNSFTEIQFTAASLFDPLKFLSSWNGTNYTPPAGCYKIQAIVGASDSTDETFTVAVRFLKNGAASGNATVLSQTSALATGASPDITVSANTVLSFSGTDTFDVQVRCIGAAGVLSLGAL